MEEELLDLDNETAFRALFQYATIGILVVGKSGTVELVNPRALKIFGYSEDELEGEKLEKLIPKESRGRHKEYRKNYFDKPKPREMGAGLDLHGLHKDGNTFPVEISLAHYKLGDDRVAVAFINDITERKAYEEALVRQKEASQMYLDMAGVILVRLDREGKIEIINRKGCEILGYTAEELIGKNWIETVIPETDKNAIGYVMSELNKGKNHEYYQNKIVTKTGEEKHITWHNTYIKDKDGNIVGTFSSGTDITDLKRTEEILQGINEELENRVADRTTELVHALEREKEMNEMKSRFVSMASHEFRTPLSTVLSSVSLIERYMENGMVDKQSKHIDRIKSSVKNLTDILNDFLSLEKLEQGKITREFTEFDLKEHIQTTIEEVDGILKDGQSIDFEHNGSTVVYLDSKMTRNIMLNLLSNAIKYSPEQGSISIYSVVDDSDIQIKVKDRGIGIPDKDQKNMFDKFFRATNVEAIQGTGLGLNIVKRYTELMDGDIDFESNEGNGTTFIIKLPRITEEG